MNIVRYNNYTINVDHIAYTTYRGAIDRDPEYPESSGFPASFRLFFIGEAELEFSGRHADEARKLIEAAMPD